MKLATIYKHTTRVCTSLDAIRDEINELLVERAIDGKHKDISPVAANKLADYVDTLYSIKTQLSNLLDIELD